VARALRVSAPDPHVEFDVEHLGHSAQDRQRRIAVAGFEFGDVRRRDADCRGELRGSQATVFAPSIGSLCEIRPAI